MKGGFKVPTIGDVVNGRYRIDAQIGRGGFGIVYKATQLGMERVVALKVMLPQAMVHQDMVERFRREAILARNLNHPNTIRLYDFGETEGNVLFIAMEFLEGKTLDRVAKEEGPLSIDRVHRVGVQILKSLAEAHQHGIIHRDLKPANIMVLQSIVGEPDFVKVLDFGIAKAFGEENTNKQLTKTGIGFGTPFYMAPEQVRGKGIVPATDLYALGLLLTESLTGKTVYTGESSMDVAVQQLAADPPPIPDWVLRGPMGPVIQRATQKDVNQRYPSASEMLRDLRQVDPNASIDVSTKLNTSQFPEIVTGRSKKSRAPMVFGILMTLLLFLAGFGVVAWVVWDAVTNGRPMAAVVDAGPAEVDVAVVAAEPDVPAAPPAPEMVKILVASSPEGATVYKADEYLGLTPMTLDLNKSDHQFVQLELRLEGFVSAPLEVRVDDDRKYDVQLEVALDEPETPELPAADATDKGNKSHGKSGRNGGKSGKSGRGAVADKGAVKAGQGGADKGAAKGDKGGADKGGADKGGGKGDKGGTDKGGKGGTVVVPKL